MMEVIKVFPETPHPRAISRAAEVLRAGGIIVYPTDTIYGLGADLYNKKALERIWRIKKHKENKPLSFILPDLKDITFYAHVQDYAYKIMRRVTPGSYTFVLNATREIPKILLQKRKTVGIRIPNAPMALSIVERLGHPILSTSVPQEDGGYHTDPLEIAERFNHDIDLILDAGISFNNPSTIVDLTGDEPVILRDGSGSIKALNY